LLALGKSYFLSFLVPVSNFITSNSLIELVQFKKTFANGAALGFDPLGMGKTPGKWAAAEIINGRLAMLGSIGLISQTLQTGKSPLEQLTGIF